MNQTNMTEAMQRIEYLQEPQIIQTQRRMAHSNFKDTAGYVYTWRDLGINPQDIGKGWEILATIQPDQTRLNEFWVTE